MQTIVEQPNVSQGQSRSTNRGHRPVQGDHGPHHFRNPRYFSVQESPPGRMRISAEPGTKTDRGRSGITLRPPMLTTVSAARPIVFTANPNVRRNSARAEAASQSA